MDTAVRTHRIAVVESDDELAAVCLAYLREGLLAGDLVLALLGPTVAAHVRAVLPEVHVVDYPATSPREPETVAAHTELLAKAGAQGRRLRLLGQVRERAARAWDERTRGELAHQHLFAEATMSSLCVYDRRITPPQVLSTVLQAHPELVVGDAVQANPAYRPVPEVAAALPVPDEPVQRTAPVLAVDDARSLPELRHQLRVALEGRLGSAEVADDVHLAASEIAANAFRHGARPVSARVWADADRVVVAISDGGTAFDACLSGFVPAHGADLSRGGMGLWLARKLCDHVDPYRTAEGLTVRLTTAVRRA